MAIHQQYLIHKDVGGDAKSRLQSPAIPQYFVHAAVIAWQCLHQPMLLKLPPPRHATLDG